MSSQLFTIPCSIGYLKLSTPLFESASSPTKVPLFYMPTITFWNLGLPTIEGKDVLGASSPLIPALHIPDPLSMTIGALLSVILLISNLNEGKVS